MSEAVRVQHKATTTQGETTMDKTTVLVREIGERLLELAVVMEQMGNTEVPQAVRIVPDDERIVGAATAAKYLGVSRRTVTTWLGEGRIPGAWREQVGDGMRWMIPASALDKVQKKEPKKAGGRKQRTNPKASAATARLRTRWTEDEDRQLMRLVDEGLPHTVIGTMMRRSDKAVTCRISALRNGHAGPAPVDEWRADELVEYAPGVVIEEHPYQRELDADVASEQRSRGLWDRIVRGSDR